MTDTVNYNQNKVWVLVHFNTGRIEAWQAEKILEDSANV